MPATYVHFTDEQRTRKEKAAETLGAITWEDIVERGIKSAEKEAQQKKTE